jgi:uncharacterized membrane protein YhaH (DUF805 family)
VGFALDFFLPANNLSGLLTIVLVLIQVRRLHDAGRSGWWALAAQGVPSLVLAPMLVFYPDLAFRLAGLAEIIGIFWVGLLRQDPGENRFGPPPGQKPVADVFS